MRLVAAVAAAVVVSAGAALAATHPAAAPCGSPTLVRTLTLKLPGGKASYSGFAAGKTYLVRFSGSLGFDGAAIGLATAPGAFRVDDLANDVLLSSFPASGLAVPGTPGAYQLAVQRDGGALRYGAPSAGSACPALPRHPELPSSSLQLAAAPAPWSGTVRVDILAYGSRTVSPGGGKTYAVAESGSGAILAREASKYLFGWKGSDYRASSVQFKLSAQVSERLGTKSKSPKLVAGTANVSLILKKVKGTGPATVTQPLTYRLDGVQDLDVGPTGQAFDFQGALSSSGPSTCRKLDVYADPQDRSLDFHVCNMEGQGTATTTITPG